jgi:hypothetical protein
MVMIEPTMDDTAPKRIWSGTVSPNTQPNPSAAAGR